MNKYKLLLLIPIYAGVGHFSGHHCIALAVVSGLLFLK
jgi:hypothetical protein